MHPNKPNIMTMTTTTSPLKLMLGNLLIKFFPQKADQLKQSGMTLVIQDKMSKMERLMRAAILAEVEEKEDYSELSELHKNYWLNRGDDYFDLTDDNFKSVFMPDCSFIFDQLREKLGDEHEYTRLVEIGTGNGDVLMYLSEKFPEMKEFYGIDLSAKQTAVNNKRLTRLPVKFVAADGFEWVEQNGTPNTIYVTSRGVLEYFTQERLLAFFQMIMRQEPSMFVAIEPNDLDIDYAKDFDSRPYGNERSFSHNYKRVFERAGFDIQHLSWKVYEDNDHKLVFIIAAT